MVAPRAPLDGGGTRSSSRSPGGELREDAVASSCPILPQVLEHVPNRKVAVDFILLPTTRFRRGSGTRAFSAGYLTIFFDIETY